MFYSLLVKHQSVSPAFSYVFGYCSAPVVRSVMFYTYKPSSWITLSIDENRINPLHSLKDLSVQTAGSYFVLYYVWVMHVFTYLRKKWTWGWRLIEMNGRMRPATLTLNNLRLGWHNGDMHLIIYRNFFMEQPLLLRFSRMRASYK